MRTFGTFIGCSLFVGGNLFQGVSFLKHCSDVKSRDGNGTSRSNGLCVASCSHRHIAKNIALDFKGTFRTSLHLGCRGCFCSGLSLTGRSRRSGFIVRLVMQF